MAEETKTLADLKTAIAGTAAIVREVKRDKQGRS